LKDKIKNKKIIQRGKGKTIRIKYYRFGLNDKIENKKIIKRGKEKK
jgi:UDP-N-acetylglucosamine transferase subunit ALG13